MHSYYAYSTMISAGFCGNSREKILKHSNRFCRSTLEIFPKGINLIAQNASKISPENNLIETENGDKIHYEVLVASPGLQNNFSAIKNSVEALKDPKSKVCSVYDDFEGAIKACILRQQIQKGNIIFANALPPARCAGAPLKVCFLFEDYLRKTNKIKSCKIHYFCSVDSLFTVPEYSEILNKMTKQRNINVHFSKVLYEIDKNTGIAKFKDRQNPNKIEEVKFDFLHFSPQFKAFDYIKNSPLSNGQNGLITVNSETLNHTKFNNVFSLGDGSDVPANKTAAAITVQAPVIVYNIKNYLEKKPLGAKYNGYTVCPIFTGNHKMLFTESLFGYPYHSFWKDNMKPKWSFYLFNRYLMPRFYWKYIPQGKWYGSKFIFAPKF